jgi:hypothetical protein
MGIGKKIENPKYVKPLNMGIASYASRVFSTMGVLQSQDT